MSINHFNSIQNNNFVRLQRLKIIPIFYFVKVVAVWLELKKLHYLPINH